MLGCLFIFIKVKNVNRFLSISLSFSAIVMMLISIFDLIQKREQGEEDDLGCPPSCPIGVTCSSCPYNN